MANQHPFMKKSRLLPVPVRLAIGLVLAGLAGLILGAAQPWTVQAGPTFAGNAPTSLAAPEAIKAAEATGACCLIDGTCIEVTASECRAFQGTYQGDSTSCVGGSCGGSPLGACCLADGSCEQKTQASCQLVVGSYQGNGTDCGAVVCPALTAGACCMIDGSCRELTETLCTAFGGTYEGDGTDCDSVVCPALPTGACCMGDGSCAEMTQYNCRNSGGSYQGDGIACTSCEIGACCLAGGSCLELTETLCTSLAGTYQGNDSDCALVSCPQPPSPTGACCMYDGSCLELTESICTALYGTHKGDGSDCDSVSCTGACCIIADGSCQQAAETRCADLEGFYQGDGSDCTSVSCPQPPLGACCMEDGSCQELIEVNCMAAYGIYQGNGSDCALANCSPLPIGACCRGEYTEGSPRRCEELTEPRCSAVNGAYQGNGSDCASADCTPIGVTNTPNPNTIEIPGRDVTFTVQVQNTEIAQHKLTSLMNHQHSDLNRQGTGPAPQTLMVQLQNASVTLTSLTDDKYGDLNGQGTCLVPQTIPAGGLYECEFTATVSGNAGDTETDMVTATAADPERNMFQAQGSATVTFGQQLFTLTVNKVGAGAGTVTSAPTGINCGGDCTENYVEGTLVTLTAHPGVKSFLATWSGDCSGTEQTTTVTLDADKTCTATFGYPVGGIVVPVSRLELVAPWLGLAVLVSFTALTVLLVRRRSTKSPQGSTQAQGSG